MSTQLNERDAFSTYIQDIDEQLKVAEEHIETYKDTFDTAKKEADSTGSLAIDDAYSKALNASLIECQNSFSLVKAAFYAEPEVQLPKNIQTRIQQIEQFLSAVASPKPADLKNFSSTQVDFELDVKSSPHSGSSSSSSSASSSDQSHSPTLADRQEEKKLTKTEKPLTSEQIILLEKLKKEVDIARPIWKEFMGLDRAVTKALGEEEILRKEKELDKKKKLSWQESAELVKKSEAVAFVKLQELRAVVREIQETIASLRQSELDENSPAVYGLLNRARDYMETANDLTRQEILQIQQETSRELAERKSFFNKVFPAKKIKADELFSHFNITAYALDPLSKNIELLCRLFCKRLESKALLPSETETTRNKLTEKDYKRILFKAAPNLELSDGGNFLTALAELFVKHMQLKKTGGSALMEDRGIIVTRLADTLRTLNRVMTQILRHPTIKTQSLMKPLSQGLWKLKNAGVFAELAKDQDNNKVVQELLVTYVKLAEKAQFSSEKTKKTGAKFDEKYGFLDYAKQQMQPGIADKSDDKRKTAGPLELSSIKKSVPLASEPLSPLSTSNSSNLDFSGRDGGASGSQISLDLSQSKGALRVEDAQSPSSHRGERISFANSLHSFHAHPRTPSPKLPQVPEVQNEQEEEQSITQPALTRVGSLSMLL
ncbi:MAG TPA: hypothetical protein VHE99_02265 [Gammaproteobacteria bacterium]|nr:hypothetical protein [Gammaproteobacteria bacterium]